MLKRTKRIEAELKSVNGILEWVSEFGVGVSFQGLPQRPLETALKWTLPRIVWANFEDSGVDDDILMAFCKAIRLESVRLSNTQASLEGIERLLKAIPTLEVIDIGKGQFAEEKVAAIKGRWPNIKIREI